MNQANSDPALERGGGYAVAWVGSIRKVTEGRLGRSPSHNGPAGPLVQVAARKLHVSVV